MARERGVSLEVVINDQLRQGVTPSTVTGAYEMPTFRLRLRREFELDKALQLAAELEDEEVVHKLQRGV